MRAYLFYFLFWSWLFASGCGNVQGLLQKKSENSSLLASVKGQLIASSGSSLGFHNWRIFLAEKKTGFGRLASIAADGSFAFSSVDPAVPYTIYLFNQDFQMTGVMGLLQAGTPNIFGSFFITEEVLPSLIFRGMALDFSSRSGVAIDTSSALKDDNTNGIPDDFEALFTLQTTAAGTLSSIPSYLSVDDDKDGILDSFDGDSNANGISDISEQVSDDYRNSPVSFWTASLEKRTNTEGKNNFYLNQLLKLGGISPIQIRLKGPSSVLKDSWEEHTDASGSLVAAPWDGMLYDDGMHFDRRSGDLFYAIRLVLNKNQPKSMQALFLEIDYKDAKGDTQTFAVARQVPFASFGALTASIDAERNITRAGSPFDTQTEYVWMVQVFDDQYTLVYSSKELAASQSQFKLPSQVNHEEGQTYYFKIIATSVQRMLGQPELVAHSPFYLY